MSADTRTQHDFYASIHEDSPRYADWARVFDDPKRVPITTPLAERVNLPIGVQPVLFVRVDLLSDDERQRLVRHLADRFDVAPEDVLEQLHSDPRHAVPLLCDEVSVTVSNPWRWLP